MDTFRSIGYEIQAVVDTADARTHDGTQRWLEYNHTATVIKQPFPNEVDLLMLVEVMLDNRQSFLNGFGTKETHLLFERNVEIRRNPAPHLAAVLGGQRIKIQQFLRSIGGPNDPDKKRANVQRGIGRREEMLTQKIDALDRLLDLPDQELLSVLINLLSGERINPVYVTRAQLIKKILQLEAEIRQMVHDSNQLLAMVRRKIAATTAIMRLDEQLLSLPQTQKEPTDASAQAKVDSDRQRVKTKKRNQPNRTELRHIEPRDTQATDCEKPMRDELDRLRGILKTSSKIRVMVSPKRETAQRYLRQWNLLFQSLGYEGVIEPIIYEGVKPSDDSPLIVGRNLNVHRNLWAHKTGTTEVHIITYPPGILISFIQYEGLRKTRV